MGHCCIGAAAWKDAASALHDSTPAPAAALHHLRAAQTAQAVLERMLLLTCSPTRVHSLSRLMIGQWYLFLFMWKYLIPTCMHRSDQYVQHEDKAAMD